MKRHRDREQGKRERRMRERDRGRLSYNFDTSPCFAFSGHQLFSFFTVILQIIHT